MTSLAAQLQRLAVPHTKTVLSQGKQRPSLLFDPKEAANLDREAIFALGLTGLEELENIDDAFMEFESSLFNQSSTNWERSLQTKEVNEQLDETITKFLLRLSPYFLLKSAHKSLEWLIYRYHIHQYNVEAIMQCVLPYHETRIFIRLLQLLPLSDPANKWHWLQPTAKGGVPLARATIVNHCVRDPGFLNFLCGMVPKYIKVHGVDSANLRSMISFYTCTLLGTLQHRDAICEALVGVLVPSILRGLKSKCLDFKAGAYMVLSQLITQISLQPEFLNQLLPYITKYVSVRLTREALVCLTLMFETQAIDALPKKCFKYLCRIAGLVPMLAVLTKDFNLAPLLKVFLSRLTPLAVQHASEASSSSGADSSSELSPARPQYADLLRGILTDVPLQPELATSTTQTLLTKLTNLSQNEPMGGWQETAAALLGLLERRYAAAFDVAVETCLSQLHHKRDRHAFREVLSLTSSGPKHEILPESSTSLLLSLNHATEAIRVLAVQHLANQLSNGQTLPSDFLQEVLLSRLADDSVKVAQAVLDMGQMLLAVVAKKELIESLLSLTHKSMQKNEWNLVTQSCLKLLCSSELSSAAPDLTTKLLPSLLVSRNTSGALLIPQTILTSPLVASDALLKGIGKYWSAVYKDLQKEDKSAFKKGIGRLNAVLLKGISTALGKMAWDDAMEKVRELKCQMVDDPQLVVMVTVILCECLHQQHSVERTSTLVSHLLDVVAVMPPTESVVSDVSAAADLGELLPGWTRSLAKSQHPTSCVVWALRQAVAAVAAHSNSLPASRWWTPRDPLVGVTLRLLDMLTRFACQDDGGRGQIPNLWRTLVAELLEMALNPSQVPCLLSMCWSLPERDSDLAVSAMLKVGSLYMLARHWENCPASMVKAQLTADSAVLACLLLALVHPHVNIRRGGLACFSVAQVSLGKDLGPVGPLVKKVLKLQEEITADAGHVSYVISNVFSKSRAASKVAEGLDHVLQYIAKDDTPIGLKERLLVCLANTREKKLLSTVTPFGLDLVRGTHGNHEIECLRLIISRLDPDLAAEMSTDSPEFQLLQAALTTKNGDIQIMALGQVTRMLFENLPDLATQRALVSAVLDVAEETKITEIANKAHRTLKQMKLDGSHVQHELLPETSNDVNRTTVKGRRRTRKSSQSEVKLSWKRVTIVLEALQSRKTVADSEELVYTLFGVLSRLMTTSGEEVEYRKRLILSCMHNMTSRWVAGEIHPKQDQFHMSSLVECVRSSTSPQTQQQALMVMASVANFFPDYILHNVMLIFTFVGSGLLRQDDSHSFQVITHTITTVVPALIQAHQTSKKSTTNLDALMGSILQVFIDARNAVPRHRCLMVFRTLTETLDPDVYLWMVLALLMESSVQGKELGDLQEEGLVEGLSSSVERDLEFGISISEQFPAVTQVKALTQLLQFLEKLTSVHFRATSPAKAKASDQRIMEVDVGCLSPQQLRLFQFHLTKIIPIMLTKEPFVNQVLESLTGLEDVAMETDEDPACPDFQAFLEQALCYVICVAKALGPLSGKPSGRFWKALLGKTYEVLDKVLYLMPLPQLLQVSSELLRHKMSSVRRKALDLLNTKLQTLLSGKPDPDEEEALLRMVPVLVSLVQEGQVDDDNDSVACRQMALFSLKLLCKVLGSRHTQEFATLLPLCVSLMKQRGLSVPVLGNALLCVAELCSTLKAHAIPHLNSFVPPLLKILMDKPLLAGNELLLTCGLTALHRLVTSLPLFLSPFLLDILTVVCEVTSVVVLNDPNKKSQPSLRLKAIRHQLSTTLASRVLVPALGKCFTGLLQKDQSSLVSVLLMTEEHVRTINREDLVAQQTALTAFFCQTFDIRNAETELSEEDLAGVEDAVVSAILAMVVRLSETAFRPMFYKFYDWACREDTDAYKNRKLAFFKLAYSLSMKLRSLFNLFVRHTLQAAAKTLDANNTLHGGGAYFSDDDGDATKSCLLLRHVLDCLHQCMVHDTDGLFQKEVFKMLLQPLVDQIENFVGGDQAFEERISKHLCPCIGQFAMASNEDASWKSLNYQVLLKMRHTSPRVRFAALQVVESIAQKLGEEYMVLIPETVPFLAELMEDDVEEVEQRCQQVISSMEDVLGESLQKYF